MREEEVSVHVINLLKVHSCGKFFDLVEEEKNLSLMNGACELN